MSYESDSGEKDYTDPIKDGLNRDGSEFSPDDITSHPCSDDDVAFEDALDGMARFTVDGNDIYEDPPDDLTSYPGFVDGDELLDHPKTFAEAKREDQIESSKIQYAQGDRLLSEDMIIDDAEKRGFVIGNNFDKYCEQNNIKLIEKYTPNDEKEQVVNISTPEQRAILARLAIHLIGAVEILRYAYQSPDNIVHEKEGLKCVRKAVELQLIIDGEKHDEAAISVAEPLLKDKLMEYVSPGNKAACDSFLEAQKKIIKNNQEIKKPLGDNPNFKKKWH